MQKDPSPGRLDLDPVINQQWDFMKQVKEVVALALQKDQNKRPSAKALPHLEFG